MAVTITYQVGSSYTGWTGSSNVAFTGLPTGVPVIIVLEYDYGSTNVATLSSFSLATDGAPTETTAQNNPSNGKGAVYLYWSSLTTANQNLNFTNSGSYVEGSGFAYSVSGHNTSDVFGRETVDATATTLDFTFDATGDAVLVTFWGTSSSTMTFGEGTWSNDAAGLGIRYWCSNLSSGAKSLSISGGVPTLAVIVEIKSSGGGSTIVPKSTRLTMLGIG